MFGTFITIPGDFATSTMNIAGPLFTDLLPFLELVAGVLLAILAVVALIGAFHKH